MRGIAFSWNVRFRPILSAKEPPVKDPTVAPASVELTTHPGQKRISIQVRNAADLKSNSNLGCQASLMSQYVKATDVQINRSEKPGQKFQGIYLVWQHQ